MTKKFRLEGDLIGNLAGFDDKARRAIKASAQYVAPQAEAWMKNNAKWTDRTSAARNGLSAKVVDSGNSVAIVLYHSVPYGVYLETRWGGKYAVIEPTIHVMAPLYVEAVGRLLFKK